MKQQEWLEARQQTIGSSEVAALFGIDKYNSPYTLYMEKSGLTPSKKVDNPNARIGSAIECDIAVEFALKTGYQVKKFGAKKYIDAQKYIDDPVYSAKVAAEWRDGKNITHCTHPTVKGAAATPDAEYLTEEGVKGIVEIKNVSAIAYAKQWAQGVPMRFQMQTLYQHDCAANPEYVELKVACWAMGQFLEVFDIPINKVQQTLIRQEITKFWKRVEDQTPPPVDGGAEAYNIIKSLLPDEKETKEIDQQYDSLLEGWLEAYIENTDAKDALALAKNKILELSGKLGTRFFRSTKYMCKISARNVVSVTRITKQ